VPKVRALVPLEDEEGAIAVGEVVDVSDEKAAEWRAGGKVSLVADEEAAAEAAKSGHFNDRAGREEATGSSSVKDNGGPQEDDDEAKPKKGKK